jgi:hypothetical protein
MQSPEWKAMAVAVAVALLSVSLLAIDMKLDLSPAALIKRIESAQASVDTAGQPQLSMAVWARDETPSEFQRTSCEAPKADSPDQRARLIRNR